MKKLLLVVLVSCLSTHLLAQQDSQLKGKVLDTLSKAPLSQAVISLLSKQDSTLLTFTRSKKDGSFSLPGIANGRYIVMVTFPKFADYVDEVNVAAPVVDMGTMAMTQTATLLKEVIIQSGRAIRIKGDTTEFVADSFIVREGATVEDLLKKFPGFQVDSKGQITAQGQRVNKVLVDGEEFFGDDPTMATQNISAKAVDKVQVFDTKSESQQITGLTGGSDGKTVNIKLKESAKKGHFGKITAGSDLKDLVDAKTYLNQFMGKRKVSVYGSKSNTSTGSLNWQEREKLGIENDAEYDEVGGYYISYFNDDGFSDWSLRGLPDSYTAGGLYSNKWNQDKHGLNTSYRFNRLGTRNRTSTLTQNILPDTVYYTNRRDTSTGLNQQHAINGKYEWKIDSFTTVKLTSAGTYRKTDAVSNTYTENLNEEQLYVNTSDRQNINTLEHRQLDNQLSYRRTFKKKGRLLLGVTRFSFIDDDQNTNLFTESRFFENGSFHNADTIDQLKRFDGSSQTLGAKLTFSEPLTPKWSLVTEYGYNSNSSSSYRNTFDKGPGDKYEVLNPAFSNNFDLNAFSHSGTALMRYTYKKVRFVAGSGLSSIKLRLNNLDEERKSTFDFLKVTPQMQMSYEIKPQNNVGFNYRGSTSQPNINQLQPIRNNEDRLNIYTGNPDLKVGFRHSFNGYFNSYKVLKRRSVYIYWSYSIQENAITNASSIDKFGVRTYRPVNVNGNRNWNIYASWYKGQVDKKLSHGVSLRANGGRSVNFINDKQNINDYTTTTLDFNIGLSIEEKFHLDLRPRVGYNASKSSLRPDVQNNYFSYGGSLNTFVMLPGKLELGSNVNFDLRERIAAFDRNTNMVILGANLGKKVFKKQTGKFILDVNDILDQNKGYSRIINSSFVTDERFERLSRYFMLTFEWTFNKMPTGK